MTAYLIVRAEVPEKDTAAFDHWYQTEHLPEAKTAFNASSATRGWSDEIQGVHYAYYEFPDLVTAKSVAASSAIQTLITEFDRVWRGRVTRTRDIVEIKQSL